MRILPVNNRPWLPRTQPPAELAQATEAPVESVQISQSARLLQGLSEELRQIPAVRADQVGSVRERLAQGRGTSPEEVAASLLARLR